jgi:hypothetical protein
MNFTFGIITQGNSDCFIEEIIKSIVDNKISNYEIIIVGNSKINNTDKVKIVEFNENIKPGWITKKKNIVVENAIYENIVLLHDYVKLSHDWYEGFLKYGENFDFCITKIKNFDGSRFRDYVLFPYKVDFLNINYSPGDIKDYFNHYCLLPYDFKNNKKTNKYMYISGAYYIIKKSIALKNKLNESIAWGEGEDVEYSKRLHNNNIIISCNYHSSVILLKSKDKMSWEKEINNEELEYFINYCNNE